MIGHRLRPRGDDGSILPLILFFVMLVLLLLMGMFAATGAFIAQRDLQSTCDETAAAVASELRPSGVYTGEAPPGASLPLDPAAVVAAVEAWRVEFYSDDPGLQLVGSSDGASATVTCYRKAKIPFGTVFGKRDGVDRTAVSSVRSPVRPRPEARIITEEELDEMQRENP